jgi:MFS transporter, AAHS family, 4-hydroxybenzoate transporter
MEFNIKTYIDKNPMTLLQYGTVLVCWLMNMLDGMDVMVISYSAPAIARAWHVSPEALGIVFSSGLIGMAAGAIVLAPYADKTGRKSMMLLSATVMCMAIYLTAYAPSVPTLILFRFISGLGIGCMLATTAALTSEYTPNKTKDFWVSFVIGGYPIGAVLSGLVSARIIPVSGWQTMFTVAGVVTLTAVPLIYFFVSESLDFYFKKHPKNALVEANKILARMRIAPLAALPLKSTTANTISIKSLMSDTYKIQTLQLWSALFLAFATLYFLVSWIPKLSTNAGLSMELAIYTGTVVNIGAWFGIVTQGYFSSKFGLKKTIGIFLILTATLMAIFNFFIGSPIVLYIFGLLGFGIQGGFVGLYAVAARLYPTEFRTTGVGWAIGIGRFGGIIGPIIGGVLVGFGLSMSANFLIFAFPTALAGIMSFSISSKEI